MERRPGIIRSSLNECELLTALAEEAAELAQAALKLRRALDGTNPTPRTEETCRRDLREEFTDVMVVADVLRLCRDESIYKSKLVRWIERLT